MSAKAVDVWCVAADPESVPGTTELARMLAASGLSTRASEPDSNPRMAVLCCRGLSPQVSLRLRGMRARGVARTVVTYSAHRLAFDDACRLMEAGAADVMPWKAVEIVHDLVQRFRRWQVVDRLVASPMVSDRLAGTAATWKLTLEQIVETAYFARGPMLLTGESGTGKELVARVIHTLDPRTDKRDFVILDCTTVVPELAGSEFFGHERGAFTGAVAPRDGAFALADGGTLFLDEVAELPLPLQAQLLRVIQEQTFKRVGGNAWLRTRFRLVCATHKDLQEEVRQGRFRHDLYYRIASLTCQLPPLRERREDIPELATRFWTELRPDETPPPFDQPVLDYLLARDYPGNVRDLKQLVARIICRYSAGEVTIGTLPFDELSFAARLLNTQRDSDLDLAVKAAVRNGLGLKEISRLATDAAVRAALETEGGNMQRAAKLLGVTDRALQMRRASTRRNDRTEETPGTQDRNGRTV